MLLDLWPLLVEEPTETPAGGRRARRARSYAFSLPVVERKTGRSSGISASSGQVRGTSGRFGSTSGDTGSAGRASGVKQVSGLGGGGTRSTGTTRGVKVETATDDEEFLILTLL